MLPREVGRLETTQRFGATVDHADCRGLTPIDVVRREKIVRLAESFPLRTRSNKRLQDWKDSGGNSGPFMRMSENICEIT